MLGDNLYMFGRKGVGFSCLQHGSSILFLIFIFKYFELLSSPFGCIVCIKGAVQKTFDLIEQLFQDALLRTLLFLWVIVQIHYNGVDTGQQECLCAVFHSVPENTRV